MFEQQVRRLNPLKGSPFHYMLSVGVYMPPVDMLEGAQNIQRLGVQEKYLIDGHQVICIYTDKRRIRQGYVTQFPTAEEWLHEREHPPDEFELPPIWVTKKSWKGE